MARAARTSTTELVGVLERLPHYDEYFDDGRAAELESAFRVGVGRMIKGWGDQLLDIAEAQPRTLSRQQTGMVDNLLHEIGEIFRVLNDMASLAPPSDDSRMESARRCDSRLLDSLDEAHRLVLRLRQREFSSIWLEQNAKPLHRHLRHIEKLLERRNRLLGVMQSNGESSQHNDDGAQLR